MRVLISRAMPEVVLGQFDFDEDEVPFQVTTDGDDADVGLGLVPAGLAGLAEEVAWVRELEIHARDRNDPVHDPIGEGHRSVTFDATEEVDGEPLRRTDVGYVLVQQAICGQAMERWTGPRDQRGFDLGQEQWVSARASAIVVLDQVVLESGSESRLVMVGIA